MAHRSMRMLVYLSCFLTCQLRDLSRIFPAGPPTDNCFFLENCKKILITAISENSSFLAKSLLLPTGKPPLRGITVKCYARPDSAGRKDAIGTDHFAVASTLSSW